MALNERTDLAADAEVVSPLRSDAMPHANILLSYIALLCLLGKSDFEAINGFPKDAYFAEVLGLDRVPSEGRSVAVLGMRNGTSQSPFRPALGDSL